MSRSSSQKHLGWFQEIERKRLESFKKLNQTTRNPCTKLIEPNFKKFQNFSLIYSNKRDFFFPHYNKRLLLFGNSKTSNKDQNTITTNDNSVSRHKIPPLNINYTKEIPNTNLQSTTRIYQKLSQRLIRNLFNESNYRKENATSRYISD